VSEAQLEGMGPIDAVARTAVVAGTATAVSNRVSRRQAERWQQQGSCPYDQPDLKDRGILTEEEFAAQKARILDG
jgi:Short C-terminal domain